jgi:hypothetical protein
MTLRRFPHEPIEIIQARDSMSPEANRTSGFSSNTAGGMQVYDVHLADGAQVKPVDWRRFAYDHAKVKELLSSCIQDNLNVFMFYPVSAELNVLKLRSRPRF